MAITILTVIGATLWTELSNFLKNFPEVEQYLAITPPLVASLSVITSAKNLFLDKGTELVSTRTLNVMKLGIVIGGVCAHVATCIELPNSYFMISESRD